RGARWEAAGARGTALAALHEPGQDRMGVGLAGGAAGREVAEARPPADDVGAVWLQRVCRGDEVGGEEPLVDQLEVLPRRVGADRNGGPHLADEVRAVDGDGTPHAATVDDDLDGLPAERDLAAAYPDGAGPRLDEPLHAADLVVVGHED